MGPPRCGFNGPSADSTAALRIRRIEARCLSLQKAIGVAPPFFVAVRHVHVVVTDVGAKPSDATLRRDPHTALQTDPNHAHGKP